MSEEGQPEIIIVRRHVESEEGHHGGAWKIAYADFVTAMMAFFLVLWILNSTNKDSQTIIARYFNPVKMEDFAKNKKGIREAQKEEKPGSYDGENDKSPPPGPLQGKAEEKGKEQKDINAKSLMNDETLFQNPYAALDQIAGKVKNQDKPNSGRAGEAGGTADAYRDPFKQTGPEPDEDEAGIGEEAGKAEEAKAEIKPAPTAKPAPGPQEPAKADKTEAKPAADAARAAETARAAELKQDLVKALRAEMGPGQAGQGTLGLDVQATDEGLLISLTDSENFGMFEIGSSSPSPKLVHLMDRIALSLKTMQGSVVLRGYTDSRRYKNASSDNWRLSASRAQMALYMLARGGLPEARVERVEGYADRHPKLPDKPEAAENRRIEILLRKPAPAAPPKAAP
jgi:chemotaxis protein MotB